MPYTLKYHPDVRDIAIPRLDGRLKRRIRLAIENRLATQPEKYGAPLARNLKGYWKPQMGDYRVVYKIVAEDVHVLAIIHRKDVYDLAVKRR